MFLKAFVKFSKYRRTCIAILKKIETGVFIGDCEVLPVFFEAS